MHQPTFINLVDAHLCSDCEAVGDSADRCPRCQSNALIAITRAIPRHRDSIRILCEPPVEEQMLHAA
jgi:primosomal protein N'